MKKIFLIIVCLVVLLTGCFNKKEDIYQSSTNEEKVIKQLEGQWIADGTQMKVVLEIVDGEPVYADDYDLPYYLNINKDGTYLLDLNNENNQTENGKYSVAENKINFRPETDEGFIWSCELLNDNELHCENYATVFMKEENK